MYRQFPRIYVYSNLQASTMRRLSSTRRKSISPQDEDDNFQEVPAVIHLVENVEPGCLKRCVTQLHGRREVDKLSAVKLVVLFDAIAWDLSRLVELIRDHRRFVKDVDLKLITRVLVRSRELNFLDKEELPMVSEIESEYRSRVKGKGLDQRGTEGCSYSTDKVAPISL
jgi:hypothetical protein